MEPIFPLTEENLRQFRGQLVCVVMQDGTRHVGILGRCHNGRLVLNKDAPDELGNVAGQQEVTKEKRRARRRRSRKGAGEPGGETARAAGFGGEWAGPPYGFSGGYRPPYGFSGGYRPPYGPYGPYGYFGPRTLLDLALVALVLLIL